MADSTLEVTPMVGAAAAAVVKALALAVMPAEASLATWRLWQVSPVGFDQRAGGPGGVNFC